MKNAKAVAIINDVAITDHDSELVQMMSDGMTAKEIAPHFNLKDKSIEARILKLRKAIGCKNSHGLIALFFRQGLIK